MNSDIDASITTTKLPEQTTVVAAIAKHFQADGDLGDQIRDLREVNVGGSFVVIKEGKWHCPDFDEPLVAAVKQLAQPMPMMQEELIQDARSAFQVPPHPNLLPVVGWIREPSFGLVTPWANGGALVRWLQNTTSTPDDRFVLVKDVAAGLCHLHERGIIHGALHEGNVLVWNGRAVINIFGLVKTVTSIIERQSYGSAVPLDSGSREAIEILPRAYLRTYNVVPELRAQPSLQVTMETDVYLLGILGYNVFTQGISRKRLRSQGWNSVIAILVKSFSTEPELRPDILEIVAGLHKD